MKYYKASLGGVEKDYFFFIYKSVFKNVFSMLHLTFIF